MPLIGSHILTPFINRLTIAAHVDHVQKDRIGSARGGSIRHADARQRQGLA
ncbi:hypothetical protein P355_3286 [Burkholderia cenocepacia KC-01]|nr:hypothetical protein P355_3286 [Burkholderia cenocepacia KC-01]